MLNKVNINEIGFLFKYEHLNKDGEVIWSQDWSPNQFADEGFYQMFDIYFRGCTTAPDAFKVGLVHTALYQTSTIVQITGVEVAGTGYARQTLLRATSTGGFQTLALSTGDMQIVADSVQFESTSADTAWTTASHAYLIAHMTGATSQFVCWQALSTGRILQAGDKLNVTIKAKGKQP